jgi:hypothetical protein
VQHTNFFYQQHEVQQTKPSKKTGGCPFHL